jgi:hypothetical protein
MTDKLRHPRYANARSAFMAILHENDVSGRSRWGNYIAGGKNFYRVSGGAFSLRRRRLMRRMGGVEMAGHRAGVFESGACERCGFDRVGSGHEVACEQVMGASVQGREGAALYTTNLAHAALNGGMRFLRLDVGIRRTRPASPP